ncbi:MAG TPA: vanadium-dependent haloperoxidase [Vicinamibacteria bacterium]
MRRFRRATTLIPLTLLLFLPVSALPRNEIGRKRDDTVLRWNNTLLQAVRNVRSNPVVTARALAVVHTAMYDAWAAYDRKAIGTRTGDSLRRPRSERTHENKRVAVSYAAYRALNDLFPTEKTVLFDPLMLDLGLDPSDTSMDPATPAGVGNTAAAAVIAFRHADGSNQLGDINGGAPYSDYTGYQPVNTPTSLNDPNRWQPLATPTGPQVFLAPHWEKVIPFALKSASEVRPGPPAQYPGWRYRVQAKALVRLSAELTDRDKMIAEYWADGPATETPPGHWNLHAQFVSRRDRLSLDEDVKLFFILGNALLDSSIAVWEAKVHYDYVRPVSAIRFLFEGQLIEAWAGPGLGTQLIPGESFSSYIATPPFAEYTSGHSGFSAASAEVLRLFTGSPWFGALVSFAPGSSVIEPGITPAERVTLRWRTFDDAADEAGFSRRLGGIHFLQADLASRVMGFRIAQKVWFKARRLFEGRR